jgi:hypothetical protein
MLLPGQSNILRVIFQVAVTLALAVLVIPMIFALAVLYIPDADYNNNIQRCILYITMNSLYI